MYVSDTRNHLIRKLTPNGDGSYLVHGLAGSLLQIPGTNDAYFAQDALFNLPVGLVWDPYRTGEKTLMVADSANHTVRRLYIDPFLTDYFNTNDVWSVETYAGAPRVGGLKDGALSEARLKTPAQFARDLYGGCAHRRYGQRRLATIAAGHPEGSGRRPANRLRDLRGHSRRRRGLQAGGVRG